MFNRENIRDISRDLESILQAYGKEHGLSIKTGSIRFSDSDFTTKITVVDTKGGDLEQVEFEKYCGLYNLIKTDYRRPFESNGKTFRIVGFKPRSPKFPVIATDNNGVQYKFRESVLIQLK